MQADKGMYVHVRIEQRPGFAWCKVVDTDEDGNIMVESLPGHDYFYGWLRTEAIEEVQVPVDYVGAVIV